MIYLACILVYLLLLTVIGVRQSRRVTTQQDFAVAGRSLSPWVMVLTMLAVWIGTGSIVGNAEQTYETGMAALVLPVGTLAGMILLSLIASRVRSLEASTVPEIIYRRFGGTARGLAMVSLVMAYMVIVSYQFNAGGAVLEVIAGDKPPVPLRAGDTVTRRQLIAGRMEFLPRQGSDDTTRLTIASDGLNSRIQQVDFRISVVSSDRLIAARRAAAAESNRAVVTRDGLARLRFDPATLHDAQYVIRSIPDHGELRLVEPLLTAQTATLIAAAFIVAYTAMAGLLSLAYMDVVTGTVIIVTMAIAFPVYWYQAGGFSGMQAAYAAMGDRTQHMQPWGVYSTTQLINYLLPVFLLVLGDANQYQRIFASRNARGARSAVIALIVAAFAIELLIIACAWAAGSMTPDPENGKYILIYAARHYLAVPLGCLFMVAVVAIIVSTADSFLLVPATTLIQDFYVGLVHPGASEKRTILASRLMVIVLGVIAYLVSLAFAESTGFFRKALYAFTIYGSAITPSLVAAIVWPRATPAGAVTSILAGTVVSVLWGEADFIHRALPPGIADLDAVLPAITVSVLCLIAVSLATSRSRSTGERPASAGW